MRDDKNDLYRGLAALTFILGLDSLWRGEAISATCEMGVAAIYYALGTRQGPGARYLTESLALSFRILLVRLFSRG